MSNSPPKKDLIVKAAIRTFAKRGYFNSRISDIVKEANIAHGLVYHYFSSKEEVLETIFRTAFEMVLDDMDRIDRENESPLDKLRSMILYTFKGSERNPDLYKVLIMDVPRGKKFYEKRNQALYNRFYSRLSDFIKEGQEKGMIADKGPPILMSHILHGSVDAVIRQYEYNQEFKEQTASFDDVVNQTIDLIFDGLALR